MKQSQKKDVQIKVVERQVYNHSVQKSTQVSPTDPTVFITTTVTYLGKS